MSRLKSKNKIKKIVYSWPVLILLLLVVSLIAKGTWGVYKSEEISYNNKKNSEEQYNELQDRSSSIISEIEMLETEKGIEAEIRDKFRVVKEGEQLAVIIDSVGEGDDIQVDSSEESFWIKIWNFLRD